MKIHLWCVVLGLAVSLSRARAADPTCSTPPVVEFASVTGPTSKEYPLETTITYACQFGYVISGSKRISHCTLTEDGEEAEWTDPEISCKPRSCGDPGFLPNGRLVGSLFTFPNSVSYECDEGYELYGHDKRYCQASGSWSGKLPRCESVSCDPPEEPENGQVTFTSLEYGSELTYQCNKGYHIEDNEQVYCTSDGTWSRKDIRCVEAACAVLPRPEHGSVEFFGSAANPGAGTLAVFSCNGNRIPDGPTTSKCLDIGQWTFPTPRCLEPCTVPPVSNGRIGIYKTRRHENEADFKEIAVGSRLEGGEKLFLHCNSGYSPLGSTTNWQERVACSAGKWSEQPHCEPKSCPSDPPDTENGRVEKIFSKHGGTVLYQCLQDFRKVKGGNVTCHFGVWKGVTPVCKNTMCSVNDIDFSGLEKGSKQIYKDGESLEIRCNQRYRLAKEQGSRLKCEDGLWKGPMPPCIAASCSKPPPSIDHGRAEARSVTHFSFVQYVCDEGYMLVSSNEVQCLFGDWNGQPPRCKSSSCSWRNLQHRAGVSPDTEPSTRSGDLLNVRCIEGYTANSLLPKCQNSVWSMNTEKSPCKEKDCSIPWVSNGDIELHTLGPKRWSFWEVRYVRNSMFTKVVIGSVPSRDSDLYLRCYGIYSVHGIGIERARIMCSQGRWSPEPVCLITGTPYVSTTRKPITTERTTSKPTATWQLTTLRTTARTLSMSSAVLGLEEDDIEELGGTTPRSLTEVYSTEDDECSCEYTLNDEKIIAYTEGKVLKTYDKVGDGSLVNFRCQEVGFQHIVGRQEMVCDNCRSWHPSEFPICVNPKQGDTVIVYNDSVTVSVDGALEVRKGQRLRLSCIAIEESEFPTWSVPNEKGINAVPERMDRTDEYLYISHLDIENPVIENEGYYECAVEKYPPTIVELRVIDPDMRCPELQFVVESVVTSIEDTRVGSKATFWCLRDDQVLNGTSVLTCMRNGEWSEQPPKCEDITCKELEGTDLLKISYTANRKVGSYANFHCFAPGRPVGVGRTLCLPSGQWEHSIPTCRTPPCSVQSLFSVLPQKVKPEMEDAYNETLPYNSTIRLNCDDNLALRGSPVAVCGKEGHWIFEEIECVSGCLPLKKVTDSKLIIMPEKEGYNFGDIVTFSCMPGYNLNEEKSRTMCFNGKWTEDDFPECVDGYKFDT